MGNASYRQTTGNQYITQDLRNYFQNDLPKFILQAKVGNGKFMKTYIMRVDSAPVVVKVYMKLNDEDLLVPAANLTIIWKTLSPAKYPNLLPYQMWIKSSSRFKSAASPVYLIRQYFSSNLYDRLSTRPFLNDIEKLWILYQLFKCLEICHEHGIVHGDIKPENVMVTTSNWVILTDFMPFKPAQVPDDDPTDFQYYFDCMGRHRCYLAPERFYHRTVGSGSENAVEASGTSTPTSAAATGGPNTAPAVSGTSSANTTGANSNASGTNLKTRFRDRFNRSASANAKKFTSNSAFPASALDPAMDVFALGCIAAEVLLDGVPLLDLPGMLKYVTTTHTTDTSITSASDATLGIAAAGLSAALHNNKVPLTRLDQEDSPAKSLLQRITNTHLRNVIIDMTQKDPASRLSVSEYLDVLQGKVMGLGLDTINSNNNNNGVDGSLPPPPASDAARSADPPLPPGTSTSTTAAASAAVAVFPAYFDSSLYPLYLKMHWNGTTPDDRVNLVCQNYGELLRSIAGVEDSAGASYFANALNSARLNTISDTRNPTVVLSADPAAVFGKKTAATAAGAAGSSVGVPLRNRSSTVGADSEAGLGVTGTSASFSRERAAQLAERSTSKFFKSSPIAANSATSSASASGSVGAGVLSDVAELSTEELLRRSEDLLREVEALCSPTATTATTAKAAAAPHPGNAELLVRQGISLSRFAEEDILAHATADVSAAIAAATAGKGSVSWGGVAKQDANVKRPVHEGLVVILDLLHANYRHLRYPQCKIVCLTLLVRLGRYCSDSVLLQRAVPLLLLGLEDQCATVRAMAVKALRAVLVLVREFSAVESNIFPLYIFPSLTRISKDLEPVVRVAFAESVGCIAETSKRFLDVAHLIALQKDALQKDHGGEKDGGAGATAMATATVSSTTNTSTATSLAASPVFGASASTATASAVDAPVNHNTSGSSLQFPYDVKLEQLKEQVSRWIRDLMQEHAAANLSASTFGGAAPGAGNESKRASTIKRLLLMDILRLCTFFGQESTMDRLLTQLLTFLNDPDWELRCAFCAKIPAVCAFLGATVTAECILPCIENAIYDCEEKVVLCAIHTLTSLVQLKLLSNSFVVDFVVKCKCLLLHPSDSLREAAVEFTVAAATALGRVDTEVFILPVIRDALQYDIAGMPLSVALLQNALLTPLSRRAYRNALLKRLYELNHLYSAAGGNAVVGSNGGELTEAGLSIIQDSTIPDPSTAADEASKVEVIKSYLDFAAREINTKTMQWRNAAGASASAAPINLPQNLQQNPILNPALKGKAPAAGQSTGALATSGNAGVSVSGRNVYNLLDMTSLTISDHNIQSILVPHQKYGTFLYRPLSDEVRRQSVFFEQDGAKNSAKMRNIYGASMKAGDSARSQIGLSQFDSALPESGYTNETTATATSAASTTQYESIGLLRKIKALDVPPLPPDTGFLMQPTAEGRIYSQYTEPLDISCSLDGAVRTAWRPKENVLLTTLKEHSGAVNRLAIAPDQSFFASASSDCTVKIWQSRQLDRVAFPRSAVTYRQHKGEVLDIAPVENSHSMATVSSDGSVHVWRVELAASAANSGANVTTDLADEYTSSMAYSSISGAAQVRHIDSNEGAALCVNHYNSDTCSVVTYATQRGGLHGWDLRAAREAFKLNMRPELGYSTSMTTSQERNWVCLGTSKGFISLFDIRYNVPCKLWRHSSHTAIHRLACCKAPRVAAGSNNGSMLPQSEGAFLFVAAGPNEAAVYGVPEGGECCKCFRTVSLDASRGPIAPLPSLEDVALPRHPFAPVRFQDTHHPGADKQDSVRALIGRISQSNMSYLVTAGTDRCIRFWDFSASNKCFTVSGLEPAQPKAMFDSPKLNDSAVSSTTTPVTGNGKLFVCYVAATPSVDKILQMHLPVREGRGIVLPSANAKDAILDLKNIDLPMKLMLSGSREGEIKLWR